MFRRLAILILGGGLLIPMLAACRPAAPPGVPTCNGNAAIAQIILNNGWGQAPGWVQNRVLTVIVPRESGCDPCAYYPGQSNCATWNPSTAKGLFQLLGHDDLIFAACPNPWNIIPWQYPACNAKAAWFLYQSAGGLGPWGG